MFDVKFSYGYPVKYCCTCKFDFCCGFVKLILIINVLFLPGTYRNCIIN